MLFGSTGAQQPSGGGFNFGGAANAGAGSTGAAPSFGFGAGNTGATAPAAGGGFSFGGGAAAQPAQGSSGFSFGGSNTTATTAAPAAGSGFGGFGSTGTTAPATGSSGFSFGGNTSQAAAPATGTSSFGFGAPAASKPPLFGQAGATTSNTTGGFGFGNTGTAAPATGTSSFGGFGTTSTAAKPAGSGFSFGGAQGTTTSTGFGFGAKPGGTTGGTTGFGFGAGTTTGSTGGFGFGAATGTGTTSTGFGSFSNTGATSSTFGAAPAAVTTPSPIIVGTDASVAQLNSVKFAYQDPMQSRFKFLMYNTVDPSQRHLYVRPPYISERLWEQAEQDNPDPLNCVPVAITGFKDLLKRIQVQQDYAEKYNNYADDLRKQLKEMEKTSRATEEKLETCRHEHVQLMHMLVKIMKDIEFLQNLGKPLQREEMNLAMALKKLQALLDAPGQYKARLNEAIALQRIQDSAPKPPSNQLSPTDLQHVYQFLDKQRQGLEHLTNLLNEDLADIKLMKETWRR